MKSKFGLKYQFSLYIVILIWIIIASIVLFVRAHEKQALTQETHLRGAALIKTMAGSVQEILLTVGRSDLISLSALVDQVKEEKGVFDVWIARENGALILHSNPEVQKIIDQSQLSRKGYFFTDEIGKAALEHEGEAPLVLFNPELNSYQITMTLMVRKKRLGVVGLNLSKKLIDETVSGAVNKLLAIASGFIVLALLLTFFLVSVIVRPINSLVEGAGVIGKGNLDHKIPVRSKNEIGTLARAFNKMTGDLKLAQSSLVEKERMEKEIQISRNIQQALLPRGVPVIKGFSFGALYRSAREVSGDYYDFIRVDPEHLGIVVADVSGKGVPASVIMAITRSIIRSCSPGHLSPYEVFKRVNYLISQNIYKGMFVTAFYGILNIREKKLTFVKAGHNYLIVFRSATQECEIVKSKGMSLGMPDAVKFEKSLEEKSVTLNPGDLFVQYSDGISEAKNEEGELFSNQRLYENVRQFARMDAQGLVNRLDESASLWVGNAEQSDDISIVAVKAE